MVINYTYVVQKTAGLSMKKICEEMAPKNFSGDQKTRKKPLDKTAGRTSPFGKAVVNCNTWVNQYDPKIRTELSPTQNYSMIF
jgi:hypothetical protein